MSYDCITCGPLNVEYHDGRDGTGCMTDCFLAGECQHRSDPAIKREDGQCWWAESNGHRNDWYLPDPTHEERTENDPPAFYKPLPGQIRFDGSVVGVL